MPLIDTAEIVAKRITYIDKKAYEKLNPFAHPSTTAEAALWFLNDM